MIYGLIAIVSTVIRQFYLPNPFECFGDSAVLYNWIAGVLIHPVAFLLVGTVYRSGDCPPLGSFLYLLAYAAITGVLALMGIFSFAWWWVLIIVMAMIAVGIFLAKLGRWLSGDSRQFD